MKTIEVDEALYRYIASKTMHIGESASDILRRILSFTDERIETVFAEQQVESLTSYIEESTLPEQTLNMLIQSMEYQQQQRAVVRFLNILSVLYAIDALKFRQATYSLQGRKRLYFAEDEQTLLEHGVHTKPKQIPNSQYWVITNTNTERKRNMIKHVMRGMFFSDACIENVCSTL